MNNKSFTLIDLLVVVLIIGILAAIALPQYEKAVIKARYTNLKSLVNSMYNAEKIYYLTNNTYTTNLDELDLDIGGSYLTDSSRRFPWGMCSLESGYIACRYEVKVGYVRMLNSTDTYCMSYDRAFDKICRSETGAEPDNRHYFLYP